MEIADPTGTHDGIEATCLRFAEQLMVSTVKRLHGLTSDQGLSINIPLVPPVRQSRDGPANVGAWDTPGTNYGKVCLGHLYRAKPALAVSQENLGG